MLTVTAVVVILTLATVQVQHSVQAAHTGSHEHSEHGTVTYVYDPVMHYLVARTHSTCYFMGLDNHQIHQVHQVNGLEQLELQMMASVNGHEEELDQALKAQLYQILDHSCRHHQLFLVKATATTTPPI
ncbi:uncharacterized protein LOC110458935 [Mizuhopecten yessoensis]|uniref:uncharacterized protein LOC110458935 n=1 Tax=Mizuhopecten yessoensis TaxID=6573 RepID=UPI000B45AF37|nr:uncharacterized protein LOC110458935 [Mizuhopecten yessoensis]